MKQIAEALLQHQSRRFKSGPALHLGIGHKITHLHDNRLNLSYPKNDNRGGGRPGGDHQAGIPEVECLMGAATAGITPPSAREMGLPMGFVRSKGQRYEEMPIRRQILSCQRSSS